MVEAAKIQERIERMKVIEDELAALQQIVEAMERMDERARLRTMRYLMSRYAGMRFV